MILANLPLSHGFNLDLLQGSHFSRTNGLIPEACSCGDARVQDYKPYHVSISAHTPLAKADTAQPTFKRQGSILCLQWVEQQKDRATGMDTGKDEEFKSIYHIKLFLEYIKL